MIHIQNFFSNFSSQELLKVSLTLFAVIDVIGMIPIIIKFQKKEKIEPFKTTLTVACIGFLFLLLGETILWLYDLELKSFRATGGIILFILGLELIFDFEISKVSPNTRGISVVPLGFPLIAGTGTLTTLVIIQEYFHMINIVLGFCLNLIIVYLVIYYVDLIQKVLGELLIRFFTKLLAILMLSMGIQFIRDGFFQS